MFMACRYVNNKPKSVLNDHQVISNLADLHVIVPADKAPNNVNFVCKTYYLSCLKKDLDLDNSRVLAIHTSTLHLLKMKV